MSRGMSRREFLKRVAWAGGVSGLTLGVGAPLFAPLLRQATADDPAMPRRFVIVVEGNCVEPVNMLSPMARAVVEERSTGALEGQRWFYRAYSHASTLSVDDGDLDAAPSLSALGGDESIVDRSAVLLGLSSKITGGGHSTSSGALSCTRATPAKAGGQTIDAWLGLQPSVRSGSPFDVLRLGMSSDPRTRLVYDACAYGAGRSAPVIVSPDVAFNYVFGAVAQGAGQGSFYERRQLLDFARADVNRVLGFFRGSRRERAKLESYLSALEEVSVRQDQLAEMAESLRGVRPQTPDVNPLYGSRHRLDALRAQFELATAALLGDLSRVVVLTSGTGTGGFDVTYSSLGASVARHDLHHQSGGNAQFRDIIRQVTGAHVEMVAQLARTLASTPEIGAEGSMLDHTAILFMSDNGEQHHSTASEWPMLLVGGESLGLRTGGRTLVWPGLGEGNHRQVSNVFNTLGHAAGVELNDFGGEGAARVAEGPLSELLG